MGRWPVSRGGREVGSDPLGAPGLEEMWAWEEAAVHRGTSGELR